MLRDIIATNEFVKDLQLAESLQNEAAFYISTDVTNPYIFKFKERVLNIYAGDRNKYSRFFNAFAGSVFPSVEICETIYSQLYRVWDSQDRTREFNFKNSELNSEAVIYIERFNNWWLSDFWEAYKYQFCSFIVVDMPENQLTFRPEPYPVIIDVSKVLYLKYSDKIDEIIFEENIILNGEPKKYYYYYTKNFYSKYLIDGEKEILILQKPHTLGHCPVYQLWNERLNNSSWVLTKTIIVPNLDDLFWFNIKTIESRKADLLYLNPDKQMPKISCGYDSNKSTHIQGSPEFKDVKCIGGYLCSYEGIPVISEGYRVLCPSCGKTRHAGGGAGNLIEIDLDKPAIKDGKVNPNDTLVKYISPDIDGVKEQYTRIKELGEYIIKHCVGSDDQPTKSAVNELQQTAIFESKESVLKRIAEGISLVRTKVDADIFKLRYPDSYVSSKYNQGTKFYLYKVEDLLEMRLKAQNPIHKRQIDDQIIEVKYRNNQTKYNEEKLLYKLLPYNTLTDDEFTQIVEAGRITDSTAINLRYQFSNAIELFESEYGSIIEFFNKFSERITEKERLIIVRNLLLETLNINTNVQN